MHESLGPSVESDLTACFVVEQREGYTLPPSPHIYPFLRLIFTPLIHRGSGITYQNENENVEQIL